MQSLPNNDGDSGGPPDVSNQWIATEFRSLREMLSRVEARVERNSARLDTVERQHIEDAVVAKWRGYLNRALWVSFGAVLVKLGEFAFDVLKVVLSNRPVVAAAIISSMLVAACSAAAAVYYVDPSGDNTASGSIDAPWQTLQYAVATAAGGDTVIFKDGNYTGAVRSTRSGTAANRIVFMAANRGGVRIRAAAGNSSYIGWEQLGDYVTVDGIVVDGTPPSSGRPWETGIKAAGLQGRVVGVTVRDIGRTGECTTPLYGIDAIGAQTTVTQSTVQDIGPSGGC